MDPRESYKVLAEIEAIQQELDQSHDTDIDYIPPYVKTLRNYVFQVHSAYEQSMQIIIIVHYLIRKGRSYESHLLLLEQITFEGKMKLVEAVIPEFPLKRSKQLNHIRNEFAHVNGARLRTKYDDKARLKLLRYLRKTNQTLNDYWGQNSSLGS